MLSIPAQFLCLTVGAVTPAPVVGARRLLDTFGRAGVWPDSVQAPGGKLSSRLPTGVIGVAQLRFAFPSGTAP
ncbi:hypothetical protein FHX52_3878 [Humibacillus xanthopallidus]|uniref:Uncharacterized protein n=1 Tax=Humibacillus xanthopallidus TaxID=412689 RepID=A0A543PKR0_9MICO|nr:hypothetical protein FHX52_3878 [Humibacillus xanthopallidus]